MTTATATPATNGTATTRAPKVKGFAVACPFCGACEAEATVRIDLNSLKECVCSSCDEEFSPADAVAKVAEQLARWQAVQR
jgi:hypothetical protein